MRYEPRLPTPGFPRRELFKLMSMLMMLVVIGMLMYRTRNPAMWRWLADDDHVEQIALTANSDVTNITSEAPAQSGDNGDKFAETLVAGPNDQQAFEWSQAEYQFQAISDKTAIAAEEMPAYWRLMRWSMTQPFDELWERAHKDRYFTHLGQNPDKHRGELIAMKVSLRRSLKHDAVKNSAGAKEVFEAWGVTTESRTGLYCFVVYDLPPRIPLGPNIHEEAEFVGYFHKLFSYEDALGKTRWAPLLIGRLRWRENPVRMALARQRSDRWSWPWLLVGAAVAAVSIGIWTTRYLAASQVGSLELAPIDHSAIEHWLETGAESSDLDGASEPINLTSLDREPLAEVIPFESAASQPADSEKSGVVSQLGMPIDPV